MYSDRGDYNHVCDLIIKEIKKIRALPNKLTFEYIQFFKRVPGSEMLKEIKPPSKWIMHYLYIEGKEVKPLRDLVSEDATVYFELLPFKLDRISNGKIVNYEVYDELDNQLLKTYWVIQNSERAIEFKVRLHGIAQKKISEKLMDVENYELFLKNTAQGWVLRMPKDDEILVSCLKDGISLRLQCLPKYKITRTL